MGFSSKKHFKRGRKEKGRRRKADAYGLSTAL